jgi:TolB-like protein
MTVSSPQSLPLSAEHRRALEILATAGLHGCTGAAMFARGFTIDMLADLVRNGLATARRETLKVGKRKITVARVWIADAGQRALDD